ncbi:MAG: hypothetical protein GX864_00870 [Mollicutes bacterium]|jgi:hypothetical protein|nr:hypothetical protein [Mollicutes bacterium]
MELIILLVIAAYVISYRRNDGENVYKFFAGQVNTAYEKYAPYSFRVVREKAKELGQEYSAKKYATQVFIFAGFAGVVAYLYFFSIIWAIIYASIAVSFIPYLAYLRLHRVYSEYIFEQVQIYTTNVIMEFNTTQSFVKSLEGVRDSGVLEDPILSDVKKMIEMSYTNGTIDQSIAYMNNKYPFYIVKNMNQLFLQITKEGARDSGESLENMLLDIDSLVEGVYRDRIDRANFHKKFVQYGLMLYFLVLTMIFLLGADTYARMSEELLVQLLLHAIIIVNSYFLITGEKYYNENVGAE